MKRDHLFFCIAVLVTSIVSALATESPETNMLKDEYILKWERIGTLPQILSNGFVSSYGPSTDAKSGTFYFFKSDRTYTWSGPGTWKDWGLAEPGTKYYSAEFDRFFPLPYGRGSCRIISFPPTGTVILFGGEDLDDDHSSKLYDLWAWTGTTWKLYSATNYSQTFVNYVFDEARGTGVFYGGGEFYHGSNQTYLYDGTSFTQVESPGPPSRFLTGMTYDPQRKRVILYGGFEPIRYDGGWSGQLHAITGTWEWDGTSWSKVRNGGPRVGGHSLTYDPRLGGVVLIGGNTTEMIRHKHTPPTFVTKYNSRVYLWTGGKKWEQIVVENPLPVRYTHWTAYSEKLGGLILFGGAHEDKYYRGIYRLKVRKK